MTACHRLFEEQVRRTPAAVALVEAETSRFVTYAELDTWTNRVAWALQGRGVGRGDLVGLRVERSVEAVVAMLGVLKAGAAYLPLDRSLPEERLRHLVAEADPRALVTMSPLEWNESRPKQLSLVGNTTEIDVQPGSRPPVSVSVDDLMYVTYTSGSTGRPKGIQTPHKSIPGFVLGIGEIWKPGQTCMWHMSMSWDGHVGDIYPALLNGAQLVVLRQAVDPLAVAEQARAHDVSILILTASSFNVVISVDPFLLAGVKTLFVAGEVLSRAHVRTALEKLPETRIVNLYGPSECGAVTSCHVVDRSDLDRVSIPVGRPVGDRQVHILSSQGSQVSEGQYGELYIGGPATTRGYLGDPRLTAERFVPDPYTDVPGSRLYRSGDQVRRDDRGLLEFAGRLDDQIKVRGFRVELEEIDAALREHPMVRDAAASATSRYSDEIKLVGYLVLKEPRALTTSMIRAHLAKTLPDHMVPAAFKRVGRIPLTEIGKLDRAGLSNLSSEDLDTSTYVGPRSEFERAIAEVWADVLGLERVGVDDDFFELGGHSLLAVRAQFALHNLGWDPLMIDLYAYSTVRTLAEHLSGTKSGR